MEFIQKTPVVVIIGAGACGIGAAKIFNSAGYRPIIFEARNILGGRVRQEVFRKNLSPDNDDDDTNVFIQLGANWIHGMCNENPFYVLARQLDLELYQTSSDDEPGDDVLLFDNSSSENDTDPLIALLKSEYDECLARLDWVRKNYCSDGQTNLEDAFSAAISECEQATTMESGGQPIFGPFSQQQRRVMNWCLDRIAIDYGYPAKGIAASHYGFGESDGLHGECLIRGGYHQLLKHMAEQETPPLDIRFQHVLTKVDWSGGDHCQLEFANGYTITCEKCLITLPIGVLHSGSVSFVPREPDQIAAVKQVYLPGLMNVVWLWYPVFFWPREFNYFGVTREIDQEAKFSTFLAPPICDNNGVPQPILMCQTYGPFAHAVEKMEVSEIALLATAALRRMFGANKVPDAVGCKCSAWHSDAFARGSWSTVPADPEAKRDRDPELLSRLRGDVIKEEEEKKAAAAVLYYASEALHVKHLGTVHGAFLAGQHAARQMLAADDSTFQSPIQKDHTERL